MSIWIGRERDFKIEDSVRIGPGLNLHVCLIAKRKYVPERGVVRPISDVVCGSVPKSSNLKSS